MKLVAKKILAVLFGLSIPILMLVSLEFILMILKWNEQNLILTRSGELYVEHPIIGTFHAPNLKNLREDIIYKGKYIASKRISTDEFGRRIASPLNQPMNRKMSVAMFGCSYTFGRGLSDEETLPYFLGRLQNNFQVFNYGRSNGGPNDMLAWLESQKLPEQMPKSVGVGVYVFIQDHYYRVIGALGRRQNAPFYKLVDGELARFGTFSSEQPIRSFFKNWLSDLRTFSLIKKLKREKFNENRLTQYDYNLFCSIIKKSKELFLTQFPKSQFVILSYDREWYDDKIRSAFYECIKKNDIQYLEYIGKQNPSDYSSLDSHPTAIQNRNAANWILKSYGRRDNSQLRSAVSNRRKRRAPSL